MDGCTVKALDPSTWEEFAAMVERNGGLFSGCWCTWFHPQVREGVAHAALVYDGDEAVAWAEYGTPDWPRPRCAGLST